MSYVIRLTAPVSTKGERCTLCIVIARRNLREEESYEYTFIRRGFLKLTMAEDDDMHEHINKLRTLAEQLVAVSAPVSEETSSLHLSAV